MNDNIKLVGKVWATIVHADGTVEEKYLGENLVTSVGKAMIAGLLTNLGAYAVPSYMAVGTSATAPVIGDTTLGAEISTNGLQRASATVTRVTTTVTNDTAQYAVTFTITGTSTIQELGIFNASSNGTMLNHILTGALTVNNGDSLTLTYKLQFV